MKCNICGEEYQGLAQDCRCTNYGKTKAILPERLAAIRAFIEEHSEWYQDSSFVRVIVRELLTEVYVLHAILREAPMPYRESTLDSDDWDEVYDKWWHNNASEDALTGKKAYDV